MIVKFWEKKKKIFSLPGPKTCERLKGGKKIVKFFVIAAIGKQFGKLA